MRPDRPACQPHKAGSQDELGKLLQQALEEISSTAGRQTQAVNSVVQLVPPTQWQQLQASIAPLSKELVQFGNSQAERVRSTMAARAHLLGIENAIQPIATSDPEADIASIIVVKRKCFGTIPLDQISLDQRDGFPSGTWAPVPITALCWCEVRRNLEQVIDLTEMELGHTKFDFVGYFRFLSDHGFVEFVKGK